MLEELQEVYPQDINNYFYVKDLKNVYNILSNNEQGSVEWTEKEFHKNCKAFTELF